MPRLKPPARAVLSFLFVYSLVWLDFFPLAASTREELLPVVRLPSAVLHADPHRSCKATVMGHRFARLLLSGNARHRAHDLWRLRASVQRARRRACALLHTLFIR